MSLTELIDSLLLFVSRWGGGTTVPRVGAVLVGLVICLYVLTLWWERRGRLLPTSLLFLVGLTLVLMAMNPGILHWLGRTGSLARIRMMMGFLSFMVLVVSLESIRRDHLQERYALLWIITGLIILFCAFFPHILDVFRSMLGFQYVTSVVAVVFSFLILVSFHFSIAMSGYQDAQSRIAQRCAILEARVEQLASQIQTMTAQPTSPALPVPAPASEIMRPAQDPYPVRRSLRGARVAVPLLIGLAVLGVLLTGLLAPQAMIGDEVTHYFMLTEQAVDLSTPNFFARVPTGWGEEETRRYPHTFLWHYVGAMVYRLGGRSFAAVQIYQSLYWIQFLLVAFLLSKSRRGVETRASLLYILTLSSLPMALLFSVTFYQDVPVAAQVLTAFYLLSRGRWVGATVFMVLAVAIKETALLFLPPFFTLMVLWEASGYPAVPAAISLRGSRWPVRVRGLLVLAVSALLLLGSMALTQRAMRTYAKAEYYPAYQVRQAFSRLKQQFVPTSSKPMAVDSAQPVTANMPSEAFIIANHPGNLRIPSNWIVYGGGVVWLVLAMGVGGWLKYRKVEPDRKAKPPSGAWLLGTGLWFLVLAGVMIRSAPDARFFLPGIPFLLLPAVEWAIRWPRSRLWLTGLTALAIFQGSQVLTKAYGLRQVSPGIWEAIDFLKQHPPEPDVIFMYPEGNYRLFPVRHDWYLGYRLREFWKNDNDSRLALLRKRGIGDIVIKKHLVGPVDKNITNLGLYPDYFIDQVARDPRFEKIFENDAVLICRVPPAKPVKRE